MLARHLRRRPVFAWAMYDWANSAFATTVLAGLFPILFKDYWNAGVPAAESTARLGIAGGVASLIVALLAPLLGAMADRGGARKRALTGFTLLGAVMTAGLFFVEKGDWLSAALLYVIAQIGFFGGIGFYDAMLTQACDEPAHYDSVSAYGYALGYLGGGLLFAVNVVMVLQPALFGFADAGMAARFAFLTVALWWAVFSLPLLLWVPEEKARQSGERLGDAFCNALAELRRTLGHLKGQRHIVLFLLAYWCYIDGVDTVIRMAVDYGMSLGFKSSDLITALLIVQFVGFPAAMLTGWLGEKIGTRRAIFLCIGVYIIVTLWATQMREVGQFYQLAVAIALVQGGVQALSRAYFARLIPADKSAEYFGFYNMLGKFAAVAGPFLMGIVSLLTDDTRWGLASVTVLFVLGAGLLARVKPAQ